MAYAPDSSQQWGWSAWNWHGDRWEDFSSSTQAATRTPHRTQKIDDIVINFRDGLLKKGQNVSYDEVRLHVESSIGHELEFAEIRRSSPLNLILRKEQALVEYLRSYRERHAIWTVVDMEVGFLNSKLCKDDWHVQQWQALEVGPLFSHSAFVGIFPEIACGLQVSSAQPSLKNATDVLADLMQYRFDRGLHARIDLDDFSTWCRERAGSSLEQQGVAINGRKLGLVIAAQNAALKQQAKLKQEARDRYLKQMLGHADDDILKEVEEARSEADATGGVDNSIWADAERLLESWRKASSGMGGGKGDLYAGLSQWARYKLDMPLEHGPLPYFLRVVLAAVVKSVFGRPVDSHAHCDDGVKFSQKSDEFHCSAKQLCSPKEIVEEIRHRMAEPAVASLPFGLKELAELETAVLAGAPSLAALIGPGGSSGFLQFAADDDLLRVALDRRLRSNSNSGASGTNSMSACTLQHLPQLTCQALEQVACQRNGIPSLLLDGAALAEAERIVRERLGFAAAPEWGGNNSFAAYVNQCPLVKKRGWRLRLEECGPLAIFAEHVCCIWGASSGAGSNIEDTVAAHLGSRMMGSTLVPPRSAGDEWGNDGFKHVAIDSIGDLHFVGLEFEAIALAKLQQNDRADTRSVPVGEIGAGSEELMDLAGEDNFDLTTLSTELFQVVGDYSTESERHIALNAIGAVPYLADVETETHWKQRFASRHGSLLQFLRDVAACGDLEKRGIRCLVVAPLCATEMKAEPKVLSIPLGMGAASTTSSSTNTHGLETALSRGHARQAAAYLVALCIENPRSGAAQLVASYFQNTNTSVSAYTASQSDDAEHASTAKRDVVAFIVKIMWWLPAGIRRSNFSRNSIMPQLESEVGWEERALVVASTSRRCLEMLIELGQQWGICKWSANRIQARPGADVDVDVFHMFPEVEGAEENVSTNVISVRGSINDAIDCDTQNSLLEGDCEGRRPNADPRETKPTPEFIEAEPAAPENSVNLGSPHAELITEAFLHEGSDLRDSSEAESELEKIREGFLLDNSAAKQLQENLGGSLERLSKDLSREQHRFVHELLQNADDCEFLKEVTPTVELILSKEEFIIRSNEVGFTSANVQALCSVDRSTKVDSALRGRELIGRKGIGFKAVFKVSNKPEVHSGQWHFHFDATLQIPGVNLKGLGYIVPHSLPATPSEPTRWWRTELRLPFKKDLGEVELAHLQNDLNALDGVILLNLQVIRELRISEHTPSEGISATRRMWKQELNAASADGVSPPCVVRIFEERNEIQSFQDYLVTERRFDGTVQIKASLPLPPHSIASSDAWRRVDIPVQPTFCFLPLRAFGWRFVLHGNFNVTASRDEIHETSKHNQEILRHLPDVLVDLIFESKKLSMQPLPWTSSRASDEEDPLRNVVSAVKCEPSVRCLPWNFALWFMPLPASNGLPGHLGGNQGDFFRGLEPSIWKKIKTIKCLFDVGGEHVEPYQTLAVPPNLEGQFFEIFPPPLLWRLLNLRYLHPVCTQALPPLAEEFLGIRGTRSAFRTTLELLGKLASFGTEVPCDAQGRGDDAHLLTDMAWLRRALTLASTLAFGGGDARNGEVKNKFNNHRIITSTLGNEPQRRFEDLARLRILPLHDDTNRGAGCDGNIFFIPIAAGSGKLLQRLARGMGLRLIHPSLLAADTMPNDSAVLQRLFQQIGVEELTPARLISCGALPYLCTARFSSSKSFDAQFIRTVADCIVYIARFAPECSLACDAFLRTHSNAESVRNAWREIHFTQELTLMGVICSLTALPVIDLLRSLTDADSNRQVLVGTGGCSEIISISSSYHGALAQAKLKAGKGEDATAHAIMQNVDFADLFTYRGQQDMMVSDTESECGHTVAMQNLRAFVLGAALTDAARDAFKEVKLGIETLVAFLCQKFGVRIVLLHAMYRSCVIDEPKAHTLAKLSSRKVASMQHINACEVVGGHIEDCTCAALEHILATRFGEGHLPQAVHLPNDAAVSFCKVLVACFHLDNWSQKLLATLRYPVAGSQTLGSVGAADFITHAVMQVPSTLCTLLRCAAWVPVRFRGKRSQRSLDSQIFFESDVLARSPLLEEEFAIVDFSWCEKDEDCSLFRSALQSLAVCEVRAIDAIDLLRRWAKSKQEHMSERLLTQVYFFIFSCEGATCMYTALSANEPLIFVPNERHTTKMSERAMERGDKDNPMRGYWTCGSDCCIMILRDPKIKDSVGKINVGLSKKGEIRELELHYHACLCNPFKSFGIPMRAEAVQLIRTIESSALKFTHDEAVEWALWVYRWCTDMNNVSQDGYADLRVLLSQYRALLVVHVQPNLHGAVGHKTQSWVAWHTDDPRLTTDCDRDLCIHAVNVFLPNPSATLPLHLALSDEFVVLFHFFECRLGMRRASLASLSSGNNFPSTVPSTVVSIPVVGEQIAIECTEEDRLLRTAASYLQIWLGAKYDFIRSYLDSRRSQLQGMEIRMGIGVLLGVHLDGAPVAAYHKDENVLSIWKPADNVTSVTSPAIFEVFRSAAHTLVCDVLGLATVFGEQVFEQIAAQAEALLMKCISRLQVGATDCPGRATMKVLADYGCKWLECAEQAALSPSEFWWFRFTPLPVEPGKDRSDSEAQFQLMPAAGSLGAEGRSSEKLLGATSHRAGIGRLIQPYELENCLDHSRVALHIPKPNMSDCEVHLRNDSSKISKYDQMRARSRSVPHSAATSVEIRCRSNHYGDGQSSTMESSSRKSRLDEFSIVECNGDQMKINRTTKHNDTHHDSAGILVQCEHTYKSIARTCMQEVTYDDHGEQHRRQKLDSARSAKELKQGDEDTGRRGGNKGFADHMQHQVDKAREKAHRRNQGSQVHTSVRGRSRSRSRSADPLEEVTIPEMNALSEDTEAFEDMPEELFSFPQETTEEQRAVGRWGEEWAFKYLHRLLGESWNVVWHNGEVEKGEWFDIKAEPRVSNTDGAEAQYFEVKSTSSDQKLYFDVSAQQVRKAEILGDRFTFLRVCCAGTKHAKMRLYQDPGLLWKRKEQSGVSLKVHIDDPVR